MSTTGGEIGEGVRRTIPVHEGLATRRDVITNRGIVEKGVTYAAGISQERIDDGSAYVKLYPTWDDAVEKVSNNETGVNIYGRVLEIGGEVPDIATDGGTQGATRANARRATVEEFRKGQVIVLHVDGSGTPVAVGDKLSLKPASDYIFIQDNTNGRFYAMEAATGSDDYIRARVIA